MAVWQRIMNDWKYRQLAALALSLLLLWAFWAVRPEWSPMHRWNRAFGDVSLVVVAMVMVLGPISRLWRITTPVLVWRRELGVWGVTAGFVHAGIILFGWVSLEWPRLFGFEWHPDLEVYVMFDKGFGYGNLIGILALVYGLVLALTSNDITQKWLGMTVWKYIQQGAYILWAIIVAHTAYFLYMHFLDFHRSTPEPNIMQWPFVILVSVVLALQTAASVKTWRLRRHSGRAASAS